MEVAAGTRVADRYVIERALAKGGMGAVYVARDERMGARVALKITAAAGAAAEEVALRFAREARIGHRLGSRRQGFVRALDWNKIDDVRLYLVMDLVENAKPLDLRHGTLDERVGRWRRAAELVRVAHEQGVIHRDLKPANFLQAPDGSIFLTDFGLAKVVDEDADTTGEPVHRTMTGAYFGTAPYMPPEQFDDAKHADQRADVFALGCMLFEALVHRLPYTGSTPNSVMGAHMKVRAGMVPAPRPRDVDAAVPAALDEACAHALELELERRAPSVATLLAALEGAAPTRFEPAPRPEVLTIGAAITTRPEPPTAPAPVPSPRATNSGPTPSSLPTGAAVPTNVPRPLALVADGSGGQPPIAPPVTNAVSFSVLVATAGTLYLLFWVWGQSNARHPLLRLEQPEVFLRNTGTFVALYLSALGASLPVALVRPSQVVVGGSRAARALGLLLTILGGTLTGLAAGAASSGAFVLFGPLTAVQTIWECRQVLSSVLVAFCLYVLLGCTTWSVRWRMALGTVGAFVLAVALEFSAIGRGPSQVHAELIAPCSVGLFHAANAANGIRSFPRWVSAVFHALLLVLVVSCQLVSANLRGSPPASAFPVADARAITIVADSDLVVFAGDKLTTFDMGGRELGGGGFAPNPGHFRDFFRNGRFVAWYQFEAGKKTIRVVEIGHHGGFLDHGHLAVDLSEVTISPAGRVVYETWEDGQSHLREWTPSSAKGTREVELSGAPGLSMEFLGWGAAVAGSETLFMTRHPTYGFDTAHEVWTFDFTSREARLVTKIRTQPEVLLEAPNAGPIACLLLGQGQLIVALVGEYGADEVSVDLPAFSGSRALFPATAAGRVVWFDDCGWFSILRVKAARTLDDSSSPSLVEIDSVSSPWWYHTYGIGDSQISVSDDGSRLAVLADNEVVRIYDVAGQR